LAKWPLYALFFTLTLQNQPYSGRIEHNLATRKSFTSNPALFDGSKEIKHNLAETPKINHNLADNSRKKVLSRHSIAEQPLVRNADYSAMWLHTLDE
jgi:hypothetical protein